MHQSQPAFTSIVKSNCNGDESTPLEKHRFKDENRTRRSLRQNQLFSNGIANIVGDGNNFEQSEKSSKAALQSGNCRTVVGQPNPNGRNKFINKIRSLAPDLARITRPRSVDADNEQPDRRERNRIAARETRDRRKAYIDLMQRQIDFLERELSRTNTQIEEQRGTIFSLQMHHDTSHNKATDKYLHIMQKLSSLLSNKSLDERNNEINICLDSIVYRVGANGKERKSVLNKLYKDIINFSLPALHRYFVWAADRGAHLFNEGIEKEEDHWYRELAQVPKDEQLERLGKIKGIFVRQKDSLTSSSKRLLEAKTIMENSGPGFDRIVNQMREIMSPSQIAELLLFVDQHQYKKEIRLFDVDYEEGEGPNTWEDNQEVVVIPRKRVKLEQLSDDRH